MKKSKKFVKTFLLLIVFVCGLFFTSCNDEVVKNQSKLDKPREFRVTTDNNIGACYVFMNEVSDADTYYINLYNESKDKLIKRYYATNLDIFLGFKIELSDGTYNIAAKASDSKGKYDDSVETEMVTVVIKKVEEVFYSITYELNGGKLPSDAATSYKTGQSYKLPIPTKEGYNFAGWYLSENFSSDTLITTIDENTNKDIKVYANWSKEDDTVYTITYETNGGTLPNNAAMTYKKGTSYILPTPTKTGFIFMGWYEESNFSGQKISVIANTMARNIKLYAKWMDSSEAQYTGYYESVNGLTGAELKAKLRTIISSENKTVTYDDLRQKLPYTDADPDNSSNVLLLFSRASVRGAWDSGSTWNREHVWPRSIGWFQYTGAGSDVQHLRPEDPAVNSTHGNKPYGMAPNGKVVSYKGMVVAHYSSTYFEPLDNIKGDIARIILYLLVRYSETDGTNYVNRVAQSLDMLLEWHLSDPVDSFEIIRNERSYEIQKNRNPFIDHPEFASMIWQ